MTRGRAKSATYRQGVLDPQAHHQRAGQPGEHVRDPRLDDHGIPDGREGRRPGLGRSDRPCPQPAVDRRDQGPHAAFGRRRDHRKRRHAGKRERAPIIGFNVRPNAKAREVAERNKVEIRYYDVIYHLTDWVNGGDGRRARPEIIENVVGRAEVKEVFPAGKRDKAAGLLVLEGVIRKGLNARLTREDVIV